MPWSARVGPLSFGRPLQSVAAKCHCWFQFNHLASAAGWQNERRGSMILHGQPTDRMTYLKTVTVVFTIQWCTLISFLHKASHLQTKKVLSLNGLQNRLSLKRLGCCKVHLTVLLKILHNTYKGPYKVQFSFYFLLQKLLWHCVLEFKWQILLWNKVGNSQTYPIFLSSKFLKNVNIFFII